MKVMFICSINPFLAEGESVFYYKALARMLHGGEEFSAGYFMPMVDRFDLNSVFDRHIVELITSELDDVLNHGTRIGVLLRPSQRWTLGLFIGPNLVIGSPSGRRMPGRGVARVCAAKSTEAFLVWFLAEETGRHYWTNLARLHCLFLILKNIR